MRVRQVSKSSFCDCVCVQAKRESMCIDLFLCVFRLLTEPKQAELTHKAQILIQLEKYNDAVSYFICSKASNICFKTLFTGTRPMMDAVSILSINNDPFDGFYSIFLFHFLIVTFAFTKALHLIVPFLPLHRFHCASR